MIHSQELLLQQTRRSEHLGQQAAARDWERWELLQLRLATCSCYTSRVSTLFGTRPLVVTRSLSQTVGCEALGPGFRVMLQGLLVYSRLRQKDEQLEFEEAAAAKQRAAARRKGGFDGVCKPTRNKHSSSSSYERTTRSYGGRKCHEICKNTRNMKQKVRR